MSEFVKELRSPPWDYAEKWDEIFSDVADSVLGTNPFDDGPDVEGALFGVLRRKGWEVMLTYSPEDGVRAQVLGHTGMVIGECSEWDEALFAIEVALMRAAKKMGLWDGEEPELEPKEPQGAGEAG